MQAIAQHAASMVKKNGAHPLVVKDIAIDANRENIAYMKAGCPICVSEGFTAFTRLVIQCGTRRVVATLHVVHSDIIASDEIGLSVEAMRRLETSSGEKVTVSHLHPISSLEYLRAKIYGRELDDKQYSAMMDDIVNGSYSNVEIAAFVTACAGNRITVHEITAITRAMLRNGTCLHWDSPIILDKHCVGGLPGNRTTPIVVSIVAAAGLIIPKTSSRAITSPAGTADTMQVMAPVALSPERMKSVITAHGGCLVWGGSVNLSPADDILVGVEKALDIDGEGQMVASVLSKKAAAGSTHVVIDLPVGPTAKVRTSEEALRLRYYFEAAGREIGIQAEVIITDGTQPVGRGIGPALEAKDILEVLRNAASAPADLREKSISLAAALLKLSGKFPIGTENAIARSYLQSGEALKKFMAICHAQGGFNEPGEAAFRHDVAATTTGRITSVNNRKLSRLAKLAGAPYAPLAGIYYNAPLNREVNQGEVLFTIHAESAGQLQYALDYLQTCGDLITIEP